MFSYHFFNSFFRRFATAESDYAAICSKKYPYLLIWARTTLLILSILNWPFTSASLPKFNIYLCVITVPRSFFPLKPLGSRPVPLDLRAGSSGLLTSSRSSDDVQLSISGYVLLNQLASGSF